MKNTRLFLSENFQFLEEKFSIYLNRPVFVMANTNQKSFFSRCKGGQISPFCAVTRHFIYDWCVRRAVASKGIGGD